MALPSPSWEHYLYTRDTAFLAEHFPTMVEAARFFTETLVEHLGGEFGGCFESVGSDEERLLSGFGRLFGQMGHGRGGVGVRAWV